jgi:hypothetical protein
MGPLPRQKAAAFLCPLCGTLMEKPCEDTESVEAALMAESACAPTLRRPGRQGVRAANMNGGLQEKHDGAKGKESARACWRLQDEVS